jgi:hypothetical protein
MGSTPILIVSGKAGSGKDTVAAFIAEKYNGVCIAQADPMKRLAGALFGFTETQLWGPSECRNAATKCTPVNPDAMDTVQLARDFCEEMGLGNGWEARKLLDWYEGQFAEYLKNDVIAPRTVLQTMGTEWGREIKPSMWIEKAVGNARKLVEGGFGYARGVGLRHDKDKSFDYAIITDGRFRNEMLAVRFLGGAALRVIRPSKAAQTVGIAGHRSEKELDTIPEHFYSGTIMNDSTFDELYERVMDEMEFHYFDTRAR